MVDSLTLSPDQGMATIGDRSGETDEGWFDSVSHLRHGGAGGYLIGYEHTSIYVECF